MNNYEAVTEAINTIAKVKPPYIRNYDDEFKPGDSLVHYSGQWWDEEEMSLAFNALVFGKWINTGDYVDQFQKEYSKKFEVGFSHMVNSGSSANLVMITALKKHFKWQDGDEIIVSPVGFPTTIAPIVQNNLKPVFVDIEFDTLNFDINLIEGKITSRTKAIFVSPVLGNPPDMEFIKALCNKHNILLIGDNCDSLGSRANGQLLNKYYFSWTSSFYPAHHICTGEGGMISSDEEEFIKLCRSISWWGRDCYCVGSNNNLECGTCGKRFNQWLDNYDGIVDHKYVFTNIGYNLKPLDFQGAIGLAQLKKLDEIERLRKKHKKEIDAFLETIHGVKTIKSLSQNDPSWFGVPVLCSDQSLKEFLVMHLEAKKIQTRNYFAGNILIHEGYKHLGNFEDYPNANLALSNVFFIGCSPLYNEKVIAYIGQAIEEFN